MSKLTPKQEKAALLIAAGAKCIDAAQEVGVTPETISQWKRKADFEATVNQHKIEILECARERMRNLCLEAVEGIKDLMHKSKSDSVKLKACVEILKMSGIHDDGYFGWGVGSIETIELEQEASFREIARSMALFSKTPHGNS